jgi:hypothetical protein
MLFSSSRARPAFTWLLTLLVILAVCPSSSFAADLQEDTLQAFERFVQITEARMAREARLPDDFLYIDSLPQKDRQRLWNMLERGEKWIDFLDTRDETGRQIKAPHGLITHNIGAMFIPEASLNDVVGVIQDYSHYHEIYSPEIVQSKLISHSGNTFEASYRAYKSTPWTDITLNINSEITYTWHDARHVSTRSHSTRIAQVESAGKPDEHEDSVGHDSGYLWRLNTYWRFEAKQGGVVAEWESVSLSREIPFLLRWIVRPYVERLARSTVEGTLTATRLAVKRRQRAREKLDKP